MIALTADAIDVAALPSLVTPTDGAVATFTGVTRADADVTALVYEAWETRALPLMEVIAEEAIARWKLSGVVEIHRTGRVDVGEVGVYCAAAAPHRDEAFEACRYLIDNIKSRVPIWKHELHHDLSTRWVGLPQAKE